jgi:hypothetical protein
MVSDVPRYPLTGGTWKLDMLLWSGAAPPERRA